MLSLQWECGGKKQLQCQRLNHEDYIFSWPLFFFKKINLTNP